jgi:hypothetical protein
LPLEFGVSPNFNILDLRPYLGEEDEIPWRTMSIQEGEDDDDINTSATIIPSVEILGPDTTCHTPFRDSGNEDSIRVPRMLHSHV